jgi:hypothetical protein
MPFVPATAALDIVSFGSSLGVVGTDFTRMAQAIANACAVHFITPGTVSVTVQGIAAGPGVISSASPIAGIEPGGMSTSIISQLSSQGMIGTDVSRTSLAISSGIVKNFMLMGVTGFAAGVGTGTGVGKLVGLSAEALKSLIDIQMATLGLIGDDTSRWSTGISRGICLYLNGVATVPVAVSVGPVIPPPAGPIPFVTVATCNLI